MKKTIIFLLLSLSACIYAQETVNKKRIIAFSPQYLIKYGIKLDFERKIGVNKYLFIGPQLYLAEKNNKIEEFYGDRDNFNLLAGSGMTIGVKNYALKDGSFGAYIGYGLTYNFFYSEYFEEIDHDIEEVKATINKFGFDITLGYQMVVWDVAIIDIYTGFGTRKSIIDNGDYHDDKFNGSPIGYNLTGNILLAGIKIGLMY